MEIFPTFWAFLANELYKNMQCLYISEQVKMLSDIYSQSHIFIKLTDHSRGIFIILSKI